KADGTVTVKSTTVPVDEISKPTITKVQPGRFKRKTSGTFTITLTGTEFEAGPTVKVGKVKSSKVTRLSSTKLKAVIPRKNLAAGKHDVTITNKDGGKVTKKRAITIVK
ncbi:MAG: IPT/TIG domain-containing protein, partial [Candidatus Kerfeldbacteria bacterium]|nr:IPT/TIG domain-containing protein [Candidatus Kerfeldbacteria bacterium]